jgi:hypothetical protein
MSSAAKLLLLANVLLDLWRVRGERSEFPALRALVNSAEYV